MILIHNTCNNLSFYDMYKKTLLYVNISIEKWCHVLCHKLNFWVPCLDDKISAENRLLIFINIFYNMFATFCLIRFCPDYLAETKRMSECIIIRPSSSLGRSNPFALAFCWLFYLKISHGRLLILSKLAVSSHCLHADRRAVDTWANARLSGRAE